MNITQKIINKIDSGEISKTEVAKRVGITRATLYSRLKSGNWKRSELYVLHKIV